MTSEDCITTLQFVFRRSKWSVHHGAEESSVRGQVLAQTYMYGQAPLREKPQALRKSRRELVVERILNPS